eukprot:scaffold269325_cov27-Tisochrysis_lutea.AAC.1
MSAARRICGTCSRKCADSLCASSASCDVHSPICGGAYGRGGSRPGRGCERYTPRRFELQGMMPRGQEVWLLVARAHHGITRSLEGRERALSCDGYILQDLVAHAARLGECACRELVERSEEAAGVVDCHLDHEIHVISACRRAAAGPTHESLSDQPAGDRADSQPSLVARA